jgi:hypothetical protein
MLAGQVAVSTAISIKSRTLRIHPLLSFSRHDRAGWDIASIHRVADKAGSRKPLFTFADAYALGPGLRADSLPEKSFRPDMLLHVWIDIHPMRSSYQARYEGWLQRPISSPLLAQLLAYAEDEYVSKGVMSRW